MKKNDSFQTMKQIIDKHNNLLLISHTLPDGDNIGSLLGLSLALKAGGKTVTPVINGELPQYYQFLPHKDLLVAPEAVVNQSFDLLICVDMSDWGRAGEVFADYQPNCPIMNFDHHYSNDYFGDYNFVDAGAASCAQILTAFLEECGYPITSEIATALYVGMLTDSGCFTYTSTSEQALLAAAAVVRAKPDLVGIRMNVFENVSFQRKKILAKALTNAVQIAEGKITYSALTYEECQELEAQGQDFEGIIDNLIGVTDVKMGIFFREMEKGFIKVGFRGRPGIDVTVVASAFGGGGHQAAAGCSLEGDFDAAVHKVLEKAITYLED